MASPIEKMEQEFIGSGYGYMDLVGVRNARDLGGMPTQDGRAIIPGRLIRSGKLVKTTAGDAALLGALNLTCIIDLRIERERAEAPDPTSRFPEATMAYVPLVNPAAAQGGRPVTPGMSLRDVLRDCGGSTEGAEEFIANLYRELAVSEAARQGYREIFNILLDVANAPKKGAVLWHCSAGKDRTGFVAFLIEYALGVPRSLCVADFLASNLYTKSLVDDAIESLADVMNPAIHDLVNMYYGVDERNLLGAFAEINKRYGSIDAYYENELGLTKERKEQLRDAYLV